MTPNKPLTPEQVQQVWDKIEQAKPDLPENSKDKPDQPKP